MKTKGEMAEWALRVFVILCAIGLVVIAIYMSGTRWRKVMGYELDATNERVEKLEERVKKLESERPEKSR